MGNPVALGSGHVGLPFGHETRAAEAEWIVTEDAHFDVLRDARLKPQPVTPGEFIPRFLIADRVPPERAGGAPANLDRHPPAPVVEVLH